MVENSNNTAEKATNFGKVVLDITSRVTGTAVDDLAAAVKTAYATAAEIDDRYKQLQKDFICAKQRFEKKQLDVLNADRSTLKAFKRAVAVVVAAVADETKTAAWFNYRALYKLGYLDKLPKEVNTTNKLAAFVRDTYTDMVANQKRKTAADTKEIAIKAIAEKFGLDEETARKMFIAGVLKA